MLIISLLKKMLHFVNIPLIIHLISSITLLILPFILPFPVLATLLPKSLALTVIVPLAALQETPFLVLDTTLITPLEVTITLLLHTLDPPLGILVPSQFLIGLSLQDKKLLIVQI